jgi:hypothetical protein
MARAISVSRKVIHCIGWRAFFMRARLVKMHIYILQQCDLLQQKGRSKEGNSNFRAEMIKKNEGFIFVDLKYANNP